MKNIKNVATNVPRKDNEKNNKNIILSDFLLEDNAAIKVVNIITMITKKQPKKFEADSSEYEIKNI